MLLTRPAMPGFSRPHPRGGSKISSFPRPLSLSRVLFCERGAKGGRAPSSVLLELVLPSKEKFIPTFRRKKFLVRLPANESVGLVGVAMSQKSPPFRGICFPIPKALRKSSQIKRRSWESGSGTFDCLPSPLQRMPDPIKAVVRIRF